MLLILVVVLAAAAAAEAEAEDEGKALPGVAVELLDSIMEESGSNCEAI